MNKIIEHWSKLYYEVKTLQVFVLLGNRVKESGGHEVDIIRFRFIPFAFIFKCWKAHISEQTPVTW